MSEKNLEKCPRKSSPWRAIFLAVCAIAIFFIIGTAIFIVYFLPDLLKNFVNQKISKLKLGLSFEKAGLDFSGKTYFENVKFRHKTDFGDLDFSADRVAISIEYLKGKNFNIKSVEIYNGRLFIKPIDNNLPNLHFSNINTTASIEKKSILIEKLHSDFENIPLSLKGKIENYDKILERFSKKQGFSETKSDWKNSDSGTKKSQASPAFANFAGLTLEENNKNSKLTADFFVNEQFVNLIGNLYLDQFAYLDAKISGADIKFNLTSGLHFQEEDIFCQLQSQIANFSYRDFAFQNTKLSFELNRKADEKQKLSFQNCFLSLSDEIKAKGVVFYNLSSSKIDGNIELFCSKLENLKIIHEFLNKNQLTFNNNNSSIICRGNFSLETNNWDNIDSNFELIASNVEYKNLPISNIKADVKLNKNAIDARNIFLQLDSGLEIYGDLNYQFKESTIAFDGETNGNIKNSLIDNLKDIEIPEQLKSLKFSDKKDDSRIKFSGFYELKDQTDEKKFDFNVSIEAKDLEYQSESFDKLTCNIHATPSKITLPVLILERGEAKMNLNLNAVLNQKEKEKNLLSIEFASNLDGQTLFKIFFPTVDTSKWLKFTGQADSKFKARFGLGNNSDIYVIGRVDKCEFKFMNMVFQNASAEILYERHELKLKDLSSTLYDGILKSNVCYNFSTENGTVELEGKNIKLKDLVSDLNFDNKNRYSGRLNLNIKTSLSNKENNLLFNGLGNASLFDTNLLSIPVISDLLELLMQRLLKQEWLDMRRLDASFALKGQKIEFSKISNSCSLVILESSGHYDWKKDYCDFVVYARPAHIETPVDKTPPGKIVLDIIRTAVSTLEARYCGYKDNRRWELSSGILDKFKQQLNKIKIEPPEFR